MPYYRYSYHVTNLINILKEKQEGEQGEMDKYNNGNMNPEKMMKQAQGMVKAPKMPNMSGFKFPS